jgi:hypothetical protein
MEVAHTRPNICLLAGPLTALLCICLTLIPTSFVCQSKVHTGYYLSMLPTVSHLTLVPGPVWPLDYSMYMPQTA